MKNPKTKEKGLVDRLVDGVVDTCHTKPTFSMTELRNIILDDVPHKYQKRLLDYLALR